MRALGRAQCAQASRAQAPASFLLPRFPHSQIAAQQHIQEYRRRSFGTPASSCRSHSKNDGGRNWRERPCRVSPRTPTRFEIENRTASVRLILSEAAIFSTLVRGCPIRFGASNGVGEARLNAPECVIST